MTTIIDTKVSALTPQDEGWVTFVRDHIDVVKSISDKFVFTVPDIDKYGNRLTTFYIEKGVAPGITWLAHLINDTDMFTTPRDGTVIYIPSTTALSDLYRSYRTTK